MQETDAASLDDGEPSAWQHSRTALAISAVILVLAAASFVASASYPSVSAQAPRTVAVIAVVVATVVAARCLRDLFRDVHKRNIPTRQFLNVLDGSRTTLLTVLMAVLYVALFQFVGFIIATTAFTVGTAYLLGVRRTLPLVMLGPVATIVMYVIFTELFGIRLPTL